MPEEESKLVEKLEEKQSAVKFSDEELNTVKQIQQEYLKVQNHLGQLVISEMKLREQGKNLDEAKSKVESNFKDVQVKERKFLDGITEKYGEGTLNPDTGEFIPNKS